MVELLKRLTDLSVVPQVMQAQVDYTLTRNGFKVDRSKLQGDTNKVVSELNKNVQHYGNQEYAS